MPNSWPIPISSTPDSKPGRYSGRGTSLLTLDHVIAFYLEVELNVTDIHHRYFCEKHGECFLAITELVDLA